MAVMTEELVPALENARQAHVAVLDRFRADALVTPPGPYRHKLERQAGEVEVSLERIQHQVRDMRPQGWLGAAADLTRFVSRSAARTAMLPLTVGAKAVAGMRPDRHPAGARQLLKNAEVEYAAAARALAACRAGEVLAEQTADEATAELLGSLRRQDEELLRELEDSLVEQARAVAASTIGFGPAESRDAGLVGSAVRTVWTAFDRVRDVALHGGRRPVAGAEDAVRERPQPGPVAEEILGAVRREEDLPIPGYGRLSTDQIQTRLPTLSQLELTVIEGYERAHAQRKKVLDTIEQLRAEEPWTGYDAMDTGEITASLRDAPSSQARQVLEYERRHRRRREAISAAEARISS